MNIMFEDPGHAWMEVSIQELSELGIASKISGYSYVNNGMAYLEEDSDLTIFFEAYRKVNGHNPEYKTIYQEHTPIRNYRRYGLEYELARRIGDKRFGSECKHNIVINGRCVNCQRSVI